MSLALQGVDTLGPAAGGLLGALLVLAGAALWPLAAWALRRVHPGRNVVFARHGFSHVVVVALVVVAGLAVAGPLVALLRERAGASDLLASLLAGGFAFALGAAWIVRTQVRLDPDGWRALGLRPGTNHATAVAGGLGAWFVALPSIFGLGLVWLALSRHFGFEDPLQPVAKSFLALPAGERAGPLVVGILVMPLLEEIVFRAFLQPLFVQNLRERAGIAATAIVFGALHGPTAFLQVTGLAIVLGAVMLRTQSLLAVWAMHAAHNGLMLWLMYNVPSMRRYMGGE